MSLLDTIRTRGGVPFTVSSPFAPQFQAFLNDLEETGYKLDPAQSGGYANRNILGTNIPSLHSEGKAVDVNWRANARGSQGDLNPDTARSLAKRYGMTWGGDWKNPDPMHFEFGRNVQPITGGLDPMTTDLPGFPSGGGPSGQPPPQAPQVAAWQKPAAPPPAGPPAMPMFDAMSDSQEPQPGWGSWFKGLASNPMFMGGMMGLAGANPAAGFQAASQHGLTRMKQDEYQRQLAQKKKTAAIWAQAFPNGQPSAEHPLTKGLDPGFAGAIYAMGPEQGLPVLGTLQMHGADARMKTAEALKLMQEKGKITDDIFNPGGQPQGQPSGADALFAQPRSILPPATGGIPGQGVGSSQPVPMPGGAPMSAPSAAGPIPAGPGGPLVMGKYTIDQARRIAMQLDARGMRNEPFEAAIKAAEAEGKPTEAIKTDATTKDQAWRSLNTALDRYEKVVKGTGVTFLPGKDKDAVQNERNNILLQLKELHKLGALQTADMAIMEKLMPPDPAVDAVGWGPGALIPGLSNAGNIVGAMGIGDSIEDRTTASVARLKEQLREIRNNSVRSIGLPPEPAPAAPAAAAPKPKLAPPKFGDIVDGYRYEGGPAANPADRKWWRKAPATLRLHDNATSSRLPLNES